MAFRDESVGQECDAASASIGTTQQNPEEASRLAESKRIRTLVIISYTVCCLIWGTTWYAIRVSVEPGDGYPPNFAGAIRFVIALIFYIPMWIFFAKKIHKPTRAEFWWMFLAGILNGMYQCFMYSCETTISGGLASVIMATSPLMVAVMAICSGFEKVRRQTLVSFLICFAGVSVVCLDRVHSANDQIVGMLFALVAAFFTSLSNITLKGRGSHMHPVVSATIFLFATDIPVWIGSFMCAEKMVFWPVPVAPMLAVVYMALMSSVVAFSFYLYLIRHMSLMGISTLQFVLPILALAVDMMLERRVTLTAQAWIGIGVVLSGVVLSMRKP